MNTVRVASPLRSYTSGAARLMASGDSIAQLLANLERVHPGMRFRMIDEQHRIRSHIRIFVGKHEAPDLTQAVPPQQPVHLLCALSGG